MPQIDIFFNYFNFFTYDYCVSITRSMNTLAWDQIGVKLALMSYYGKLLIKLWILI